MKKILAVAALALVGGSLMAQAPGPGRGMMGPGVGAIEWKIGTVVTTEYKKVTGQLVLGQNLGPVLKADGVEYQLMVPRRANPLVDAKNGDTITVEGTATTVKSETKVAPVFVAFKVTINGKEIDVRPAQGGRGDRGDRNGGQDDPFGAGPGNGPGDGNGPRR